VIYTKDDKIVNSSSNGQELPDEGLKVAYLYATKVTDEKKESYMFTVTRAEEDPSHEKLFVTDSINEKKEKVTKYNPNYFYSIKMLPEGDYYVNIVRIYYKGSSYLEQKFDNKNSPMHFTVKANQVNYLGDLFFFDAKKVSTLLPSYKLETKLFNQSFSAQNYIKHYHPEVSLIFSNSLMSKNGSEIVLDYVDPMNGGLLGGMISSAIDDMFEE